MIEIVLETDMECILLLEEDSQLSGLENNESKDRHMIVLKRLEEIYAFSAPAHAAHILRRLGFYHDMQHTPIKCLSGGWRMQVTLTRGLLVDPDILLLDEPTNHLDIDAVFWLEKYIQNSQNTVIIVSHAREFLNNVCTHTIHFFES